MKNLKELILPLYNSGDTNLEISNKTKIPKKIINSFLNRNSFKSNRYKKIIIDDALNQFIIGGILGDLSITKVSGLAKNSSLSISHTFKHKDYTIWKSDFLKYYNLNGKIRDITTINNRYKEGLFREYRFRSESHPIFTNFRNKYYDDNGNKRVPLDIIYDLQPLGLAIWFMDDGYVTKDSFMISTCSFHKEELEILKDMLFKNFNIKCNITKQREIYILAESRDDFKNLILDYILPIFNYKLIPYSKRGSV